MDIIYRKESSRSLSEYQKHMNTAAQQLCIKNPRLLRKRQLLIDEARTKILEEGFQFVKGKSRSKKGLIKSEIEPKPKRQKMNQDVRDTRMKALEEIKDYDERISFKERRIATSLNISDYKACDELKDAVMELKKKKRELEAEMKHIATSNRQSIWYYRKKSLDNSGSSSEPLSPLAYESSSDVANSSVSADTLSVPKTVSESPVFCATEKSSSVSPTICPTQRPGSRVRSVSSFFGSAQKSSSRAGSVSPGFGSTQKPSSRAGSVSPIFASTQRSSSRAESVSPVFGSTQKPSRCGIKVAEDSSYSSTRSPSPQSQDSSATLTQKNIDVLSNQPKSSDCLKGTDEVNTLSQSSVMDLSQLSSCSPDVEVTLIDSSHSSPIIASSQLPLFSQPEPSSEDDHHSESSDISPFQPSLPATQQL